MEVFISKQSVKHSFLEVLMFKVLYHVIMTLRSTIPYSGLFFWYCLSCGRVRIHKEKADLHSSVGS